VRSECENWKVAARVLCAAAAAAMGKFKQTMGAPPTAAKPRPPQGKGVLRTNTEPALMGITNGLENQVIRAAVIPGPANYPAAELPKPKGGRFNNGNAKSGLEWEMYRSAQIPGPAEYPAAELKGPQGGRFSTAFPKTDVEWQMYRAARQPGPMEYGPVPTDTYKPTVEHAQLGVSGPQNDLDGVWNVPENAIKPGPGEYPGVDKGVKIGGGRFNNSRAKSDLEWTIFNAKRLPGPADYDTPTTDVNGRSATVSKVGGGKWNRAASKSGLEWDIYRASQLPGPDYDTNAVYQYLEGKSGGGPRKGARILGRAGFNLPAPFNQYYSGTESEALTGPSESHDAAVTGFRRGHGLRKPTAKKPQPPGEASEAAAAGTPEPEPEPEPETPPPPPQQQRQQPAKRTVMQHLNERLRQQVRAAVGAGRSVNGIKVSNATEFFNAIDTDQTGSIDPDELATALERLDIGISRIAHDGDGYDNDIDTHQLAPIPAQLASLVKTIDKDQDGTISVVELEGWLQLAKLEDGSRPDTRLHLKPMVRMILTAADIDCDGCLSREEFVGLQEKCGRGDAVQSLTLERWAQMCEAFGSSAGVGIDLPTLLTMYSSESERLLDDFQQLGLQLTQKEMAAGQRRAKQDALANRKRGYMTPKHLRPRPPAALRPQKHASREWSAASTAYSGGSSGMLPAVQGATPRRAGQRLGGDRTMDDLPPRLRLAYQMLHQQSKVTHMQQPPGGAATDRGGGNSNSMQTVPSAKALLSAEELQQLYGSANGGAQTERAPAAAATQ